jgi:hypothetical protein
MASNQLSAISGQPEKDWKRVDRVEKRLSCSTIYFLFSTLYSPKANGLTAAGSPGILFEVVGIKQLLGSFQQSGWGNWINGPELASTGMTPVVDSPPADYPNKRVGRVFAGLDTCSRLPIADSRLPRLPDSSGEILFLNV